MKKDYKSIITLTIISFICSVIIYLVNRFVGGLL